MYAYGKWPTGCYFISLKIQIEDAYKNRQISYFIDFSLHYKICRSTYFDTQNLFDFVVILIDL